MARLKAKQIEDFNSVVQGLIDNDADQNAGLIDALEASVDSLEVSSGGNTSDINASIDSIEVASAALQTVVTNDAADADASIDSLETLAGTLAVAADADASIDSIEVASAALQAIVTNDAADADASIDSLETLAGTLAVSADTDASIDSLEIYAGTVSSDLANEATARGNADTILNASVDSLETATDLRVTVVNASIDSLEVVDGAISAEVATEKGRIDAILSGSAIDLDSFAEIVSFVASVDTLNDGIVSDLTANTGASIDSLEAVVGSNGGSADASIDSLETEAAGIQSDVDANEADADASIDSLETALTGAVSNSDASINSLELMTTYRHYGATVTGPTTFTVPATLGFGQADDLLVFVNGHNIHPIIEGSEVLTDGYSTIDGVNFTLTGIGYSIDVTDHVYVTGHSM